VEAQPVPFSVTLEDLRQLAPRPTYGPADATLN
jgi:hypothetical protein